MASDAKIDQFLRDAINRMLKPHNVDMQFVMDNPEIDGVAWYQYYTWSKPEMEDFEKWFMAEIRKRLRISKHRAGKEFAAFNLMWGLKENG